MDPVERRLLERAWFPVARVEDVARGAVHASILGTDLVVYRAGEVTTVADASCPHRGAALWMGAVGAGGLECPYHGWRFEPGTGRCVHVPSLPPGSRTPRAALGVHPVREAYGHVWSCLDRPLGPPPEMLGLSDGWQLAYGEPADVGCGMRQLTENFRDLAHFPFVHHRTMGPGVRRVVEPYAVRRDGWRLTWTSSVDLGGTALEGRSAVAGRQTVEYHVEVPMFAYAYTSFPEGGRRLVAQFTTPIAVDGLRVRQFWVVGVDEVVAAGHGVSLTEMCDYERRIFEEDHPIVENQRPLEAPLATATQAHTRADRFSLAYRRLYAELLATLGKEVADADDDANPHAVSAAEGR